MFKTIERLFNVSILPKNNVSTVVIITGGFDPLHGGHIDYIRSAAKLGKYLCIGLNSDEWLARKKGQAFMSWYERAKILRNMKGISRVFKFNDDDDTANDAIEQVVDFFYDATSTEEHRYIFANGGDRNENNIPETAPDGVEVEFVYNVGGGKTNSSSNILRNWAAPKTIRPWGYYRVWHKEFVEGQGEVKCKDLVVNPHSSISMQYHNDRSETWVVVSGVATIKNEHVTLVRRVGETYDVIEHEWHQLSNETDALLHVMELQYGARCDEDDIERKVV